MQLAPRILRLQKRIRNYGSPFKMVRQLPNLCVIHFTSNALNGHFYIVQRDLTPAETVSTFGLDRCSYDIPASELNTLGPSCGLVFGSGSSEFNRNLLYKRDRSLMQHVGGTVPFTALQSHGNPAVAIQSPLCPKSTRTGPEDDAATLQSSNPSIEANRSRPETSHAGTGSAPKVCFLASKL